jgi:hypothetical protein
MTGCDNNNNASDSNTEEYEVTFTKGMQTHIQETEKGVFKITDEKVVEAGDSKAIVTFLNGQTDTLSLEAAKRIVDANTNGSWDDNNNNNQEVRHGSYGGGLGNALMYGALGYYLGRSMNSRPNPGFYASPAVYNRAQQHTSTIQNARVSRPVNSSKGYFKGGTGRSVGA